MQIYIHNEPRNQYDDTSHKGKAGLKQRLLSPNKPLLATGKTRPLISNQLIDMDSKKVLYKAKKEYSKQAENCLLIEQLKISLKTVFNGD